ncbi:MAG: hemolysin family protein, partial [Candidatus Heimdallarchaeota archaeon]
MNILIILENLDSGVIQASMVSFFDLFLIFIFTILNGFFVTAEFSLLRIPKTKIATLKNNGGRREEKLDSIYQNFNLYISSIQIGISLTSIIIGWLGIDIFVGLTRDFLSSLGLFDALIQLLGLLIGLFIVLSIHSILGEIIPKIFSFRHVESIALNLAIPIYYFTKLMTPISVLYRKTAYFLLKTSGLNPKKVVYTEVYSEEELKYIIAQSKDEGEIDETELEMIERILDFTDTTVKSILTPRYKIVAFPITITATEIIQNAKETGYSRFPIYENKLDDIRGFVHIKDIITVDIDKDNFSISEIMRKVVIVHEGM